MPQQLKTCKRKAQDDEFYTMYRDCVRELHKYDLRGYKIICPCDTKSSNIYIYILKIVIMMLSVTVMSGEI